METAGHKRHGGVHRALKPSLVEWKHGSTISWAGNAEPLKPSLVEWKLKTLETVLEENGILETFLGGMETPHSEREVCEGTTP